jgi:hypothetical protein
MDDTDLERKATQEWLIARARELQARMDALHLDSTGAIDAGAHQQLEDDLAAYREAFLQYRARFFPPKT